MTLCQSNPVTTPNSPVPVLPKGGHMRCRALGNRGPAIMAPMRSKARKFVPLRQALTLDVFMLLNGNWSDSRRFNGSEHFKVLESARCLKAS